MSKLELVEFFIVYDQIAADTQDIGEFQHVPRRSVRAHDKYEALRSKSLLGAVQQL
jgi:hypothetical protein